MIHPDTIDTVKKWLEKSRKTVITSHHNPDGDAIGSVLALYLAIKGTGSVSGIVPNDFPQFLKWMPGVDEIDIFEQSRNPGHLEDADLIFCLDYNDLSRTGAMKEKLMESKAKKVLIDHHPGPKLEQFEAAVSSIEVSSTAELVHNFLIRVSGPESITKDVATAIYVGIMTDTGSFSFNCNYPETFEITANLLKTGIDGEYIHRQVYDNYSEARIRLLGHCLSEKLTMVPEMEMAFIALTREELERFGYQTGDTEGVVNYPLSISGVKVSVLLTERRNKIRLSFRSKGNFKVNQIARDHFEGGGHNNAAGGDSFLSMDKTIIKLLNVMESYKAEIRSSGYEPGD